MAICRFFLEGRCRYGEKCWNEHPGGGRRPEQSRYHYQQSPAGSGSWSQSSNQRYVQPSNFSKSTTWSRGDSQTSFAPRSDHHDNRNKNYNSGSSARPFSSQNRFSTLSSQDHSRDQQSDKEGNLFEEIKRDLDTWVSSGQWIFSVYSVKDGRNLTGFADISPEELRLECYTARDSGNIQNYVNSVQQLANQWKQRIQDIKNTNYSSQATLLNELTKPATNSGPTFGGQQSSAFTSASSATSNAAQPSVNFSFKSDSQYNAPSGPVSTFPSSSGLVNKPETGFGSAVEGSAASFSFAATTASSEVPSGFNNANTVTAATFSFAPTTSSGVGASAFSGFAATASTALPANTSVFASTTAASVFGQITAPGFGAASGTSGFGLPATNTPTSGFGLPATNTPTSGFGLPATNTPTSGFGFPAANTPTSGFGAASGFGFPAANTPTSSFGSKTTAVSDLFRTGAASSASSSQFGQTGASTENPVFTPQSELSAIELSQFQSQKFTFGNVPLRPPPANLLIVQ